MRRKDTWAKLLIDEMPVIIDKVNKKINTGNSLHAIKILEGFLHRHPYSKDIQSILGQLHFEQNNLINAGQYWYFVEHKDENQLLAVKEFERTHGNDPLHILKVLMKSLNAPNIAFSTIYEKNYKIQLLDCYSVKELDRLLKLTIEKHKIIPHFAKDFIEIFKA